jgi:beta-lactam-binding protein with PASTA domain
MNFIRFIFTKTFWIQVLIAIGVVLLLCIAYLTWLDWYTNHGQQIEVPDLKELTLTEAQERLEEKDLRSRVIDSSNYNPDFPPRSIIEQDPEAGKFVKENRQIYIKVNKSGYGKVTVPVHRYETKRAVIPKLRALGFTVGEMIYKPGYKDMVLELQHKGQKIEPGDELEKTSIIDIVLGKGDEDDEVPATQTSDNERSVDGEQPSI